MKLFWVDVRPWNKEIATTALESGADALMVDVLLNDQTGEVTARGCATP